MFIFLQPFFVGNGFPRFVWPIEDKMLGRGTWAMSEACTCLHHMDKNDLLDPTKHSRGYESAAILFILIFFFIPPNWVILSS